MMISIGNFLFHYRNVLFPVLYLTLFVPSPPLFQNQDAAFAAGIAVCLIGQVIRIMTIGLVYIIRGGSNRRIYAKDLVTTGMFAHCRNPLYVGNILVLIGLGLVANSLYFLVFMAPFFLFAYQAIVRAEENFLFGKFGDSYRDYMHDVNRWIPSLKGIGDTFSSMKFHWKRVFLKEYTAMYIWTAGALALYMRNERIEDGSVDFMSAIPFYVAGFLALTAAYFGIMIVKKKKILRAD